MGLTENTTALRRWCVCGPEIARVLNEFESCRQSKVYFTIDNEHHDATLSTQVTFLKHVKSLVATIEDNGNPFLEDSKDIYCLDTKEVNNEKVVHTVYNIEEIGKKQFNEYIENILNTSTEPVTKTIKKNNLAVFSTNMKSISESKARKQIKSLKDDVLLFSRLFIACQAREGDL